MSNVQDEAELGPVEVSSRNEDGSALLEEEAIPEDNDPALTEDIPGDLLQDWQENGEKDRHEGPEENGVQNGNNTRKAEEEEEEEGTIRGEKYERPSSADGSVSMSDDGPSVQVRHMLASNKSSR